MRSRSHNATANTACVCVCVVRLLLWVFGGGGARKFSTCRSNFAPRCGMRACDDASNECVEETRSSIIIFVRAVLRSQSRHCFEVYAVSRSIIMILSFFCWSLRDCQLFVSVVCVWCLYNKISCSSVWIFPPPLHI